jgi:hypothetical protein
MAEEASTRNKRLPASAATDNATLAYDGPCVLNHIAGTNAKAAIVYLKLYRMSAAQIAAGTVPTNADTPFLVIPLEASKPFNIPFPKGVDFPIGLGFRLVTGSADNDNTAVAANDILALNLLAR